MKTKKIILIVFAIFSGIVTFSQNLEEGQVSYYPFSGNADDASGNGYNGLITGGTFMNNDTELDISGIDYLADASETTTLIGNSMYGQFLTERLMRLGFIY